MPGRSEGAAGGGAGGCQPEGQPLPLAMPCAPPGYLSEVHAQYVWPESPPGPRAAHRPAPRRRPTTLRLQGELLSATESHDQYAAPPPTCRPPLARRGTALHLEGRFTALPSETHEAFVSLAGSRRAEFIRRPSNLVLPYQVCGALSLSIRSAVSQYNYKTKKIIK